MQPISLLTLVSHHARITSEGIHWWGSDKTEALKGRKLGEDK